MDAAPGHEPEPAGGGSPPAGGSDRPEEDPNPAVAPVDHHGGDQGAHGAADGRADGNEQEPPEGSDPLRFNKWMKRSATGAVLTGISLGLREALEPTRNQPAFMIEASGEPEDPDNPIQLHFDPDSPEDTVAVIRRPSDKVDPETPPAD